MKKQTILITLLILSAIFIGLWRGNTEPKLTLNTGTAFTEPLTLPQFSLIDMRNQAFTNGSLKNKWSFVFFGYSHCPQICPVTLNYMKQIAHSLHRGPFAQFVFISINPEKDTPQRLTEFLQQEEYKQASILGVTGNKETIAQLANTIGIHIAEREPNKKVEHFEHGGAILLINPEGKLAAVFSTTNKPQAIVHDFKEIAHYYASVG